MGLRGKRILAAASAAAGKAADDCHRARQFLRVLVRLLSGADGGVTTEVRTAKRSALRERYPTKSYGVLVNEHQENRCAVTFVAGEIPKWKWLSEVPLVVTSFWEYRGPFVQM